MSEEKFTPGDWGVEDYRENDEWNGTDYAVFEKDKGYLVASIENCSLEEQEANANLIAAAPKMYQMLKYLADGIRWGGIEHTSRSLADEIEKVLKKARGEE